MELNQIICVLDEAARQLENEDPNFECMDNIVADKLRKILIEMNNSECRWVESEVALPDMGVTVLTFSTAHGILPQRRDSVQVLGNHRVNYAWKGPGPFQNFAHNVTHWMPLPEPPQ